jgi:RecB family exonuclease
LEESLRNFIRNVTRLSGKLTMSYPCWDIVDDRELFPSSVVLSAFRLISGNREADQNDLDRALPAAASFAAETPAQALDEAEWWLSQLCGQQAWKARLDAVECRFPHLARGRQAFIARQSDTLTSYDGYVPEAGVDHDPTASGKVLSASSLETAGRCPLKYYFSYVLNVRPLEELIFDPECWLDALSFGQLLHSVFRQFLAELCQRHEIPDFNRDEKHLADILRAHIHTFREAVPPPNETALRRQCRELRWAARVFLNVESVYCQKHTPQFFETSIGLPAEGTGSNLDETEPIALPLPTGQSIRTCGRIDRIDRIGSGRQFAICDYKTGSSWQYDTADPFQQGRFVQHAIYLSMVQAVLRRRVDPEAVVESFDYFFPNAKTWGKRIGWTSQELAGGLSIIERLCRMIASGTFLPTNVASDCNFCDYQAVCGDLKAQAATCQRKLDNDANAPLLAIRELRRRAK